MNNAAWVLRRSPLFLLAGDGSHRFQPVHVRDIAELMEELGRHSRRRARRWTRAALTRLRPSNCLRS